MHWPRQSFSFFLQASYLNWFFSLLAAQIKNKLDYVAVLCYCFCLKECLQKCVSRPKNWVHVLALAMQALPFRLFFSFLNNTNIKRFFASFALSRVTQREFITDAIYFAGSIIGSITKLINGCISLSDVVFYFILGPGQRWIGLHLTFNIKQLRKRQSYLVIILDIYIMQKKISNSSVQSIQDYSSVSTLPQQVIEFFESRIETEQQYAKALQRLNNKFPNIESHPTQSSKVLKHLKGIHSEKYHQTIQFITQLREDKNNFQNAISKFNEELQKSVVEVKIQQVNLKNIIDKINKLHTKGQEQIRNLDEKFLLKELGWLGNEYRAKKIQQSVRILEEEGKICSSLKNEYEELKNEGEKTIKKIKKNEKTIIENSPLIQKQIIELVKKYTVQEVSLIRNLQYDIDTMIKRTNIFDEVPQEEEREKVKAPKNAIVKAGKDLFKTEFKVKDYFEETKKSIASLNEVGLRSLQKRREESKNKQLQEFVKIWIQNRTIEGLLQNLTNNFQAYKVLAQQFFQHFRNKNVNKFNQKQFAELNKLFIVLVDKFIEQKDFLSLQKLVYFGSCYTCQPQKGSTQTLFDFIKKKEIFSDIYFWKFLLFFVITKSVCQSIQIIHEKQMHMKNNVFSSLVSNCMNMIGCGIDKYLTKNTVAKMAKSFGLEKTHVQDLLKFIENGWQKYEKQKGKK